MKLFITCQRFFPFAPVVCLVNFIFLSKGVTRHQHNVWNRSVKYLPCPQICFPYNVYSCLFLFPFFYFAQKMKMNHADSGSGGPSTKISIDNPILTFTPKKGNASQCRLLQGLPVFFWNMELQQLSLDERSYPGYTTEGTFKTDFIMNFKLKQSFCTISDIKGRCPGGQMSPGHFSTRAYVLPGHLSCPGICHPGICPPGNCLPGLKYPG